MRTPIAVATTVALTASLAACGSSSHTASTSSSAKAVNPNAKEVSPAGDIPDNQAYVAFKAPGASVSVKVPEGWSRTSSGGAVVFTDKLNTVRVETAHAGPLSVHAVKQTQLPQLRQTTKGFKGGSVTQLSRAGGTAVRIKYLATAAPNPVTGKSQTDAVERYLYVHNGRELILTLSGPKGADNVDPWRLISDSVRWR
jgi:hypothetical protein